MGQHSTSLELDDDENFLQNKYGWCFYAQPLQGVPVIYNLYIHPECRRHGHARRLLEQVIATIRLAGYSGEIQIEADPTDGAISSAQLRQFYTSLNLTLVEGTAPYG